MCATVILATVAETSGPFTVLPGKVHTCAVTLLLKDTLMDPGAIHRQTGYVAVKDLALGAANLGCKATLFHLPNFVLPYVSKESPRVSIMGDVTAPSLPRD